MFYLFETDILYHSYLESNICVFTFLLQILLHLFVLGVYVLWEGACGEVRKVVRLG